MVTRWTERLLTPYEHVSARSIAIIVLVNYVTFDLYRCFFQPAKKSRKQNQIVRNYIVFGNDCVFNWYIIYAQVTYYNIMYMVTYYQKIRLRSILVFYLCVDILIDFHW